VMEQMPRRAYLVISFSAMLRINPAKKRIMM
jgi:hypothetical protein